MPSTPFQHDCSQVERHGQPNDGNNRVKIVSGLYVAWTLHGEMPVRLRTCENTWKSTFLNKLNDFAGVVEQGDTERT
jgi:hypothetical protein